MSHTQFDPLEGERKEDILGQEEVQESIRYGASHDELNYKKLFAFFFIGIFVALLLVIASIVLFRYAAFQKSQEAAINAQFYELDDLRAKDNQILTTFDVVDENAGTFRVPVDSAFTLILDDYNQ
ncbi:MAG: hypothetical protein LAT57_03625 [Balneolales bacterium]|nr:hypothetical protein [Balneolales bacterium]